MPSSARPVLLLVGFQTRLYVDLSLIRIAVYFIYPETANMRLEDMNSLFGDATTAMPTPAQEAEVESLMSASRSPVPSLDLHHRPGDFTADSAIPGLDIDPPKDVGGENNKTEDATDGIGGWISRMVNRTKGDKTNSGQSGTYRRLGQQDD